jgi:hypothetical protein
MNRIKFFILATAVGLFLFNGIIYSQVFDFFDDFELHEPGQQLACQDTAHWTTWNLIPCDPVEDPYISTNYSLTGTKSVKIVQNNDLVNTFGSHTSGYWIISFWIYIPSGKAGYFNTLTSFTPNPFEWGMECYFDLGGGGRLLNGGTVNFSWESDTWQFVKLIVNLDIDQARFLLDETLISTWQWSRNGLLNLQLEASDFFGVTSNDEMYIDNFVFVMPPLTIPPLNAPTNLTAEEIFNPYPRIQLTWQDNSNYEYAFNVLRKDGPLFGSGSFEPIGTAPKNLTTYTDSTVIVDSTYTYAVVAYNQFEFSDWSNYTTVLVVVPVEMVSFSYQIKSQKDVELSWTTATETNNQGFEILRKVLNEDGGWNNLGFVPGHGTTTETQQYSFTDNDVSVGKYQYRLKQIDFDGSFEYSNVIEVEIDSPDEFNLSQNYPNPFNPSTKIKFEIPGQARNDITLVTLKVYDIIGNEIATVVNKELTAGEYEVEFSAKGGSASGGNATNLPSGVYFYQLRVGGPEINSGQGIIQTKKMVLMK